MIEITVQPPHEGSLVSYPVDEKRHVWDILFICRPVKERRREVGAVAAVHIDF
jgi:hypothetical protein